MFQVQPQAIRLLVLSFILTFFLIGCGGGQVSPEEKERILREYKDSVAQAEKARQDSIDAIVPDIKVRVFKRTGIVYDSEGWPVEMGTVKPISDFQEKKECQLSGYDYIQKIEVEGQSDHITIQFLNAKTNAVMHEEKDITLSGTKTYTSSNPDASKDKYHLEKLVSYDGIIIKVLYKEKAIFDGRVSPSVD